MTSTLQMADWLYHPTDKMTAGALTGFFVELSELPVGSDTNPGLLAGLRAVDDRCVNVSVRLIGFLTRQGGPAAPAKSDRRRTTGS